MSIAGARDRARRRNRDDRPITLKPMVTMTGLSGGMNKVTLAFGIWTMAALARSVLGIDAYAFHGATIVGALVLGVVAAIREMRDFGADDGLLA
jgi:hypothetical protein